MNITETDYIKFKRLLEFFVKQWEENAKFKGKSGDNTQYGNTWDGTKLEKFNNFEFNLSLVEYSIIKELGFEYINFTFGTGYKWNLQGSNYLAVGWINIVPIFDQQNKKIIKLQSKIVQTEKNNNMECQHYVRFKNQYNGSFCEIPVNNAIIAQNNSDMLFDNFIQIIKDFVEWEKKEKTMLNIKGYVDLLEANHNLILTGAPGTGKTYMAKQIAKQMIFGHTNDELTHNEKTHFDVRHEFVQFHPSYDYTDFVEGLRPTAPDANGNIGFELKDGVFKKFCKNAVETITVNQADMFTPDNKNFVFIIDEINRGEISKIFGELFFSIDPAYRGKDGKVKTQYQNMIVENSNDVFKDGFYVPKNVYIIGTMNDIDRSVESFDFAMRRRFTWKEITAEESAKNMKLNLTISTMNRLNMAISNIGGLNSSYHIGGAYFLDREGNEIDLNDDDKRNCLWSLRLKPLLSEYLRGMSNADEELKKLEKAYNEPETELVKEDGQS